MAPADGEGREDLTAGHLIESTAFQEVPEYEFMYGLGYGDQGDQDGQSSQSDREQHGRGVAGSGGAAWAGRARSRGAAVTGSGTQLAAAKPAPAAAESPTESPTAAHGQASQAQPPGPVVGPTPALHGRPGGPGFELPGGARRDRGLGRIVRKTGTSAWQRAQTIWRASGVEWQRPITDREPVPTELDDDSKITDSGVARPGTAGPGTAQPGTARLRHARGDLLRGGLVLAVVAVVAVTAVVVLTGRDGKPRPWATRYSAARLADASFTTDSFDRARGIDQSISRIVAADSIIVAVGSQVGARLSRAQFFVSADGGHTWRMAPVSGPGGGEPSPGHLPRLVAGGDGAWLAVGPDAIWTSTNGRSWVLSEAHGIAPLDHGDKVTVLTRTASGFLAGGVNRPSAGAAGGAVIWTSPDGLHWRRHGASQLERRRKAGAPAERALSIRYAAALGGDTVVAGAVLQARRSGSRAHRHMVISHAFGLWHSTDGGLTWARAAVPVSNGAANWIDGIASGGSSFLVVRPAVSAPARAPAGAKARAKARATAHARTPRITGGVAYLSTHGSSWRYAGQIRLPGGAFLPRVVKGSGYGFAVIGQAGHGYLIAFASPNGTSWRPTPTFGRAPEQAISGVTPAPDGTVIAVGATAVDPVTRRPILAVAAPGRAAVNVDSNGIPHATDPELAVNAVAAAGNDLVAVGSANGYPAIWSATAGGPWSAATGTKPAVLARPGIQTLTDVVHGPAGWLGVGVVTSSTPAHPIVVTSVNGRTWQAADSEPAFAVPGAYTYQAAAGHSRYVVAGKQVTNGRTVAAAWWSTALTGWQRAIGEAPGDLGGTGAAGQMLAIAAQPFGFIAVGSYGSHPAAWTSADGRRWRLTQLPLPGGAAGAALTHVAAGGGRVVAMGTAGGAPFAAVSTDGGQRWRETMLSAPPARASVTALAAAGRGFTAAGTYGTPGNQNVVVWSSDNGRAWRVARPAGTGLSGPGIQAITGLAASGRFLTGVGYTASQTGEHPTIWRVPLR